MKSIRLITRADDAGCCSAANRAILAALGGGVLKNISIMVPGPAFDEAAAMFAGIDGIDLGLHVTLNAEWPVKKWGPILSPSAVPALVDENGQFLPTPNNLNQRHPAVDQLIAETAAQLQLARDKKLALAYVDEHMGVGWLPGFRDALQRFAEREGLLYLHAVPFLRLPPSLTDDPVERLSIALSAVEEDAIVHLTHPMFDGDSAREMLAGRVDALAIIKDREADRRLWLDHRLPGALSRVGAVPSRYSETL